MTTGRRQNIQHWLYITALIVAGESIYLLPYLRKTFQTSMEAVFGLSSMQVGWLSSLFGVLAVLSYFPSGYLADRFPARRLLSFSLFATGTGGLFMLTLPDYRMLLALHAVWGITSILTFWAALIKATRNWGGPDNQGTSFGLLDGGRGVVAALLASAATAAYASVEGIQESMQRVILIYSVAPILTGVFVWFVIPDQLYSPSNDHTETRHRSGLKGVREAIGKPQVWLLALIIFCSYMLYVGIFDFPAYAEKAYGRSKTFGAVLGTVRDWMRPLAAISAGLLADRIGSSKTVSGAFALLTLTFLTLGIVPPDPGKIWILWIQVVLAAFAVFALRGVYFAIMQEAGIPLSLTGITVGIVSFVGFTPDVFLHTLSGWLVDHFPDNMGYRYFFGIMALVAAAGLLTALRVHSVFCKKD